VATRDLAAPVVLVVQLAPVARMRLPSWAVPAGPAEMPGLRAQVRPALMGLPVLRCHAMVALAARAAPAAWAAMPVLAALEAVAVLARVVAVAWVKRASAALVAVAASAALGSMRAASTTARLVVMPGRVALVERAVLLARSARTPRRCLAVPAGPAVMLGLRALVRPVQLVLMALLVRATVAWVAPAALVALAQTAALVEQAELAVVVLVRPAGLVWLPRAALAASVALAATGSMQAF
jgi:hypothetical protein